MRNVMIAKKHCKLLDDSGITLEMANAWGLKSLDAKEVKDQFGVGIGGIAFPYYALDGELVGSRVKLEKPLGDTKYLQAKNSSLHLYFLKSKIPLIKDANVDLHITEGEKKAAKYQNYTTEPVLSSPGCWNWKKKGEKGLAGDWNEIPFQDRKVNFLPDTDFYYNPKVRDAGIAFIQCLVKRGATVNLIDLRDSDKKRVGVDDFIIKHGYPELQARVKKPFYTFQKTKTGSIPRELSTDQASEILKKNVFTGGLELKKLFKVIAEGCKLTKSDIASEFQEYAGEWKKKKLKPENTFEWNKDEMPIADVCLGIGSHLSRKKNVFYEPGTYNLCRIEEKKRLLQFIVDGHDLSTYLGLDFLYKRGYVDEEGFVSSEGYQQVPSKICDTFLLDTTGFSDLRPLKLYTKCPTLSGNKLISAPGYHEESQIFYDGDKIYPKKSLTYLTQLLDFPYENKAHFANAAGLLIGSVLLREEYLGEHPMGIIRGDEPNLGKSKLARSISYIACENEGGDVTYLADDTELEKRIGATLKNHEVVLLDNVKAGEMMSSAFLERAITSRTIETRDLGASSNISRRNNILFFTTLNEGEMSDDLITRSVSIFLTGKNKTKDFDPLEFAIKHRKEILKEIAGMVTVWQEKGCPTVDVHFPKFSKWASVVNGILLANGIKGFLSTHRATANKLNPEFSTLVEVGGSALERIQANKTEARPASYWRALVDSENPKLFKGCSLKSKATKVGKILSKMVGKEYIYQTQEEDIWEISVGCDKSSRGGKSLDYYFNLKNDGNGNKSGTCSEHEVPPNNLLKSEDYHGSDTFGTFLGLLGAQTEKNKIDSPENRPETLKKVSDVPAGLQSANIKGEKGRYIVSGYVSEEWNQQLQEMPIYSLNNREIQAKWWDGEDLGKAFSFDVETDLIQKGYIPQVVLASAFNGEAIYFIEVHRIKEFAAMHVNSKWIAHNIAFDLSVVSNQIQQKKWGFDCVANKNALDTWILARLINLATEGTAENIKSKFTLSTLSKDILGLGLPKEIKVNGSEVRTSYGHYLGRVKEAPAAYFHYNAFDTIATWYLWRKLEDQARSIATNHRLDPEKLLSHYIQVADSLSAFNTSHIGFRVDTQKARENGAVLRTRIDEIDKVLLEKYEYSGGKGQKDKFNAAMEKIEKEKGITFPRIFDGTTKKELISQKKTALKPFKGIEFLDLYNERQHLNKCLKMSVAPLEDIGRVHPHISILKNTGRNGMSKPNLQQIPRDKDLVDMRAQLIASEGKTLYIADYCSAELVTLAQICTDRYNYSRLGDAINQGHDVHKITAARFLGKDPDDVTKDERQYGKIANFGLPGGLGVKRLVDYARDSYGVKLSELEAKGIKEAWVQSFPEMKQYLSESDKQLTQRLFLTDHPLNHPDGAALHGFFRILEGYSGTATTDRDYSPSEVDWAWENASYLTAKSPFGSDEFKQSVSNRKPNPKFIQALKNYLPAVLPRSGRIRANCSYTEFNNTPFQGLLSDITNTAWFKLLRSGFNVVCVIHDEFVVEVNKENPEEEAKQIKELMLSAAKHFCPDVKMGVDGHFSDYWSKG